MLSIMQELVFGPVCKIAKAAVSFVTCGCLPVCASALNTSAPVDEFS